MVKDSAKAGGRSLLGALPRGSLDEQIQMALEEMHDRGKKKQDNCRGGGVGCRLGGGVSVVGSGYRLRACLRCL